MATLDLLRADPGRTAEGLSMRASGLASDAVTPMVEAVLRAALDRLDAEAAAAHEEAVAVVAAAVRRSADVARSVGARRGPAPAAPTPAQPLGPSRLPDPDEDDLGPEVATQTAAQVYDLFWADIPSDQPLRERLRRWAQRPPL